MEMNEVLFRKIERQNILFDEKSKRKAFADLEPIAFSSTQALKVNVWRNHNFESLMPIIDPYFSYVSKDVEFTISDYDDSFAFHGHELCDLEVIWIDPTSAIKKIGLLPWINWIEQRLVFLRSKSSAPILVASWSSEQGFAEKMREVAFNLTDLHFADLHEFCKQERIDLVDVRLEKLSGSPLSRQAQFKIAQKLACHWISGLILPPIKAIAIDLDNTIHSGVLGEDGINGVRVTEGYLRLHAFLRKCSELGIFLALISRNDERDVIDLFDAREDYGVSWDDFSTTNVGWCPKSQSIADSLRVLNISPDSMLFVDDNAGEVFEALNSFPDLNIVLAQEDPALTLKAMQMFPGLWRWSRGSDDRLRVRDLKANKEREALLASVDYQQDYFETLNTQLKFSLDDLEHTGRASELSLKTNQFNLSLARLKKAEIEKEIYDGTSSLITIELEDKLSDSGIIAFLLVSRSGSVKDLCISCRALGRGLENAIIGKALEIFGRKNECQDISFHPKVGLKNAPARRWLSELFVGEAIDRELSIGIGFQKLLEIDIPKGLQFIYTVDES